VLARVRATPRFSTAPVCASSAASAGPLLSRIWPRSSGVGGTSSLPLVSAPPAAGAPPPRAAPPPMSSDSDSA
jgi:hypothetical protein